MLLNLIIIIANGCRKIVYQSLESVFIGSPATTFKIFKAFTLQSFSSLNRTAKIEKEIFFL